jgi:hypothetical protein
MNLERLKESQMTELMQWSDTLENIITPDVLVPTGIKEYPHYIETSERLKRICNWKASEIKAELQNIEDKVMQSIESAEYVFKMNAGGMPIYKKKFSSAAKQQRELRLRLSLDEDYQTLLLEYNQWKVMYSDWVSHANRLHRDFRLLEINYQSNGGEGSLL